LTNRIDALKKLKHDRSLKGFTQSGRSVTEFVEAIAHPQPLKNGCISPKNIKKHNRLDFVIRVVN